MTTAIRCAAVSACLLLAATASAQDRLFAGGREFGAIGGFGRDLGPAEQVAEDSVFGGLRFAASWEGFGNTVTVLDGRSAQRSSFAGYLLATDRARPRIFVARADGVWGIDVVSLLESHVWSGAGDRVQQCAHAESPNRLYCTVARLDARSDMIAIDVTTRGATTLATLALAAPSQGSRGGSSLWKTTSDGRRVYFAGAGGTLAMFDTTTAVVVNSAVVPVTDIGRQEILRLDAGTGRVITFGADDAIHVFSEDLALLGSTVAPATCNNVVTSPHTGRLYLARFNLLSQCPRCGGGTSNVTFQALDATTYTSLAGPVTPPTITTFRAAGVPAGTYYLRLRGGNEVGGGRPSNEVRVVVPGR